MIVPFPACACRFFEKGICLRLELLNPGFHTEFACARLQMLSQEWDDFLERAEAFGLAEDTVSRIWHERNHPVLWSRSACPSSGQPQQGAPQASAEFFGDCVHFRHGLCLAAMPCCPGRCEHYERASS